MIETIRKVPYYWRKRWQMPGIVVNKVRQTIIKDLQILAQSVMYKFTSPTITPSERNPQIIVSLTSIPPRLKRIHIAIESILHQTTPPDRIILWLSHEYQNPIFSQQRLDLESLPKKLLNLRDRGLEIRFARDVGSHGKLLHALTEFPNDTIITIDDDALYDKNLVARLYQSYLQNGGDFVYCNHSQALLKDSSHAYALPPPDEYFPSNSSGLNVFIFGFAGVLYPPNVLHKDVFSTEVYADLAPYEDDTWFTTMRIRNSKAAFQVERTVPKTLSHRRSPFTITGVNVQKVGEQSLFEQQLNRIMQHYNIAW